MEKKLRMPTSSEWQRVCAGCIAERRLDPQLRRLSDAIRTTFNIEPAALTGAEAQYLIGFRTADEIRNRSAAARSARKIRMAAKGIREEPPDHTLASSYTQATPAKRVALHFADSGSARQFASLDLLRQGGTHARKLVHPFDRGPAGVAGGDFGCCTLPAWRSSLSTTCGRTG